MIVESHNNSQSDIIFYKDASSEACDRGRLAGDSSVAGFVLCFEVENE